MHLAISDAVSAMPPTSDLEILLVILHLFKQNLPLLIFLGNAGIV